MPGSAVSVRDLDRHWLALNLPFLQNGSCGPLEGPAWSVVEGVRPVTLTAVHGVVHARPGAERKRTEANTGGLVLALADHCACWAGVVRRSSSDDDANWSDEHPLKRALVDRGAVGSGRVVVDVHGMTDAYGVDIALGPGSRTDGSLELAEVAAKCFESARFEVDADGTRTGLDGAREGTVTRWAQSLGCSAIQVEIARRDRSFLGDTARRIRLLEAFVALLTLLPGTPQNFPVRPYR